MLKTLSICESNDAYSRKFMEAKLQIPWNRDYMDGTLIVRAEYGIIDWLVGLWRIEKNLQTLRGRGIAMESIVCMCVCGEKIRLQLLYFFLNVRTG